MEKNTEILLYSKIKSKMLLCINYILLTLKSILGFTKFN